MRLERPTIPIKMRRNPQRPVDRSRGSISGRKSRPGMLSTKASPVSSRHRSCLPKKKSKLARQHCVRVIESAGFS